ncbi:MAG: arginyltransferase [Pseudomonadota bacterium]|nr:MAG: arginyltransferase [Pseudomonadota bacterium]
MKTQSRQIESLQSLQFYVTPPHACSYLPEREAVTLFADPTAELHNDHYAQLSAMGFRRSGDHLYRPHCRTCRACIPVRIPVDSFTPNRSQRRTWRANADLRVNAAPATFSDEQFALYRRYIQTRHPGGGMDNDNPDNYMCFISSPWSSSKLYEFRAGSRLLCVAVTDHFRDGLSAVYTYFDPEPSRRALGVYAVLWQVEKARDLGLRWVYLGYWIRDCLKMSYKSQYRPLEHFRGSGWELLPADPAS